MVGKLMVIITTMTMTMVIKLMSKTTMSMTTTYTMSTMPCLGGHKFDGGGCGVSNTIQHAGVGQQHGHQEVRRYQHHLREGQGRGGGGENKGDEKRGCGGG